MRISDTVGGAAIGLGLLAVAPTAVFCATEQDRLAAGEPSLLIPARIATSRLIEPIWRHPWDAGFVVGALVLIVVLLAGAALFPARDSSL